MLLQIQTQTGATCRPLVLVPVLVLGTVALSLHLWWTFRRVKQADEHGLFHLQCSPLPYGWAQEGCGHI